MSFQRYCNWTKKTGQKGEKLAVAYLKQVGYRILHTNYSCALGEVDIIAKEDDVLVFVEVKTRRTLTYGSPFEAVNAKKQRQLIKVAEEYMQRHQLQDTPARFDVIGILLDQKDQATQVDIIRHAFECF